MKSPLFIKKQTLIKNCINELRTDLYCGKKSLQKNDFELYNIHMDSCLTKIMFMKEIGLITTNQKEILFKIWNCPKNIKNPYISY